MFKIRFKRAPPLWPPTCWQATTDDGLSWHDLKADNEEDSSEAVDEAAKRFGVATNKWDILD